MTTDLVSSDVLSNTDKGKVMSFSFYLKVNLPEIQYQTRLISFTLLIMCCCNNKHCVNTQHPLAHTWREAWAERTHTKNVQLFSKRLG